MGKIVYLAVLAVLFSTGAAADEFSGTWKFEQVKAYGDQIKNIPPPKTRLVQIINGKLALPDRCFADLKKTEYFYSDVFQPLTKQGVVEESVASYLAKNFSIVLPKKSYYAVERNQDRCQEPFGAIFVSGNKLVSVWGGSIFYIYTRTSGETDHVLSPAIALYGRKLTQLPFSIQNFNNHCASAWSKKGLQLTEKCGPVYYPYWATKKNADPLAQLIGTHNYVKGGGQGAYDYDDPWEHDLHPVFMILPPLKDVLLVRVDDSEGGNEQRDVMSGAYLAIKDGKVTDQLNEGCDFDTQHFCLGENGEKWYQLLESGKFKPVR